MSTRAVGNWGEDLAVNYLKKRGFSILFRNVYINWGEIDIISYYSDKLYFFEVKFSRSLIHAEELFTRKKRIHLFRTIKLWLADNPQFQNWPFDFGLIAIQKLGAKNNIKVYFSSLY